MWDEKNEQVKEAHPNHELINKDILFTKTEWLNKLVANKLKGTQLSSFQLKQNIKIDQHNIFDYVDDLVIRLKGKKSDSTLANYKKHLRKLEAYVGSRTLAFEDIDVKFLQNYE